MILAAITTHKRRPEMVERALKSVVAQTYQDWNLVVVDDSPADYEYRDDVRKMVEGWAEKDSRICYVQHDKNYGVSHARNTALEIARNTQDGGGYEFIAYLDDDDEWLPEKLEKQIARFNECDENTAIVYCGYYRLDDIKGTSIEVRNFFTGNELRKEMMRYNVIGSPSFVLIRSLCLFEVGGFDSEISVSEDTEVWLRILEKYEAAYVDEPLVKYHLQYFGKAKLDASKVCKKRIREILHMMQKNNEYYTKNKYACWIRVGMLVALYRQSGEYGKSLASWFRAIKLQPFRIVGNIRILLKAWFPALSSDRLKDYIHNICPEWLYWHIVSIYRKFARKFL